MISSTRILPACVCKPPNQRIPMIVPFTKIIITGDIKSIMRNALTVVSL